MNGMEIAIIGVGLIGGSLGLALKASDASVKVIGIDKNSASLKQALDRGAADIVGTDLELVKDADVVFLATPVLQINKLLPQILPKLKKGAILTDTGSTKAGIKDTIRRFLPDGVYYVGGHPMAGREKSGVAAADKELFQDKWYIITNGLNAPQQAVDTVVELVRHVGAKVTFIDEEQHDLCAAVISHVPHVAAAALANLLSYYPGHAEQMLNLAGGGFCDTTRIASSDADMWADICIENAVAVSDGLEHFQTMISNVLTAIRQNDRPALHSYFKGAKLCRDTLLLRHSRP